MFALHFCVLILDENLLQPIPDSISGTNLGPELVGPQGCDGVVAIDVHVAFRGAPIRKKRKRFCKGRGRGSEVRRSRRI